MCNTQDPCEYSSVATSSAKAFCTTTLYFPIWGCKSLRMFIAMRTCWTVSMRSNDPWRRYGYCGNLVSQSPIVAGSQEAVRDDAAQSHQPSIFVRARTDY